MPTLTAPGLTFPAKAFPGTPFGAPSGLAGELLLSEVAGRYSHLVKAGRVQCAYALIPTSSPVIYSTNTLTGGPVLWNPPGSNVDAHILGLSFNVTTVASTGTEGGIGITTGSGQQALMASTTAIDTIGNCLIGGPASQMTVYRTATPAVAGSNFMPLYNAGFTAVSAQFKSGWVELMGLVVVGPGSWCALSASSTQTNMVSRGALIWAELPV